MADGTGSNSNRSVHLAYDKCRYYPSEGADTGDLLAHALWYPRGIARLEALTDETLGSSMRGQPNDGETPLLHMRRVSEHGGERLQSLTVVAGSWRECGLD